MKDVFDKILEWADKPLKIRYNVLLALVVLTLGYVIINRQNAINALRYEYNTNINNCNNRLDVINNFYEKKINACNENYLRYLQENEKEIRRILYETKQIKDVVNENVN